MSTVDDIDKLFTEGQIVGHLPLSHANEFLNAFKRAFPAHRTAFVSDVADGGAAMVVYPTLTSNEKAVWLELSNARYAELESREQPPRD